MLRFELTTFRVTARCSTTELLWLMIFDMLFLKLYLWFGGTVVLYLQNSIAPPGGQKSHGFAILTRYTIRLAQGQKDSNTDEFHCQCVSESCLERKFSCIYIILENELRLTQLQIYYRQIRIILSNGIKSINLDQFCATGIISNFRYGKLKSSKWKQFVLLSHCLIA